MKNTHYKAKIRTIYITLFISLIVIMACNKNDDFNLDPNFRLDFSNDTVLFDTVFTSIGSITKNFRVYNHSDEKISIQSIRLLGGENSNYRINIDGSPELYQENIEIAANDSMYIFVRANIDPTNDNTPFIINDKIEFITNENIQQIDLIAWGQNANYIIANQSNYQYDYSIIAANGETTVWDSPKPYVVYGTAVVDTNATLQIEEGVKIYFHKNSGIDCKLDACLKVNGTLENPVILKGDRLDEGYRDLSEQWNGIFIAESNETYEFNYAQIENASYGIKAEIDKEIKTNKLKLRNTIIKNMRWAGIYSHGFDIDGANLIIANCGLNLIEVINGGDHTFTHCTFANYWNSSFRISSAIRLSNFHNDAGIVDFNDLNATFANCIISGVLTDEINLDLIEGSTYNVRFDHCSLKYQNLNSLANPALENCLINPEIVFEETEALTFKLHDDSPLIDAGAAHYGALYPIDIYGGDRSLMPDIGAIEHIPDEDQIKMLRNY